MKHIFFIPFLLVIMNGCGTTDAWVLKVGQHPQHIETQLIKSVSYDLLVYTPGAFGQEKKNWPLIIFLHGSGERGSDPNKLKVHSLPRIVESEVDFPFLVVSPQCPEGKRWNAESLNAMLDEVITKLPVDTSRIYLTGLSMGGYGVWKFAIAYPERFAAIAPVCGWGHLEDVEKLKTMPIWIFHGAKDDVVPLSESEKMVAFLEKKGNTTTKFTVYPNANHNSWDAAYATKELYDWFLLQSRK